MTLDGSRWFPDVGSTIFSENNTNTLGEKESAKRIGNTVPTENNDTVAYTTTSKTQRNRPTDPTLARALNTQSRASPGLEYADTRRATTQSSPEQPGAAQSSPARRDEPQNLKGFWGRFPRHLRPRMAPKSTPPSHARRDEPTRHVINSHVHALN